MIDERFMRLAIEKAAEGIAEGQTPFGACIVRGGEVISCEHNRVWEREDATAHAEIVAIRAACHKLHTVDLAGCTIYSTCEPCPMCFSAIHWANISTIVYGASIADAEAAGFRELHISNDEMQRMGGSELEIVAGVCREECAALFARWMERGHRKTY